MPLTACHSDLTVREVVRVSITYDIQYVDELAAAQFLAKMRMLMNDPELLLL